ncbi:hypothetical protein ACO0E1_05890 [Curtobacterium sp. RRHDQ66]|uniref:hypothetical protein n=1 Tax=Curtobacterium guangdongense TaxID=3413380 RepID=UPI003BF1E6DC
MNASRPSGVRLALRFPTTIVVGLPYLVLFLPMAIWDDNPGTDFIIRTAGVALAGTFAVEATVAAIAMAERRSGRARRADAGRGRGREAGRGLGLGGPSWHADRVAVLARAVTVLSVVANLALALLGGATLRSQVDGVLPSGVLTVLTPFVSWSFVALAMIIAARFLGGFTTVAALRWILVLVATQAVLAYISNLTARATTFLVLALTLMLLTRMVATRWIVITAALGAVVWPTVYAIRNVQREANGIVVSDDVSATDRLRFDEQIARAEQFGAGHDLGQPDLWTSVRYGLVPRALDPGRPAISSGNLINEFLGGVPFSSYTFLPVATTWFFWGSLVLFLVYAGYAVIMMTLRPWQSIEQRPNALIVLALMIGGPLSWFATPPDVAVVMLQTLVSTSPVFVLLLVWAKRSPRSPSLTDVTPAVRELVRR